MKNRPKQTGKKRAQKKMQGKEKNFQEQNTHDLISVGKKETLLHL